MAQCMSPLPFYTFTARDDVSQAWMYAREAVTTLALSEQAACSELDRKSGRTAGSFVVAEALTGAIDGHMAVVSQLHLAIATEQLAAARVHDLLRDAAEQAERYAIEDAAYCQLIEEAEETEDSDRFDYLRTMGATL